MSAASALKQHALSLLPSQFLLKHGPRTTKRLALTFDDGPDEATDDYLRVLDELNVPATFFLMGDLLQARPQAATRYIARGHQIASHGYDHHAFPTLGFGALREQIRQTERLLGPQPTPRPWVRPPYGAVNATTLISLARLGVTVALWSVDSCDYELQHPADIVAACTRETILPGDVFLFHEGQQRTLEALPAIVAHWQARGFEFVTMADLVRT